jgi:ABC-type thiamin/hydroxymethylpyrimidine transport system permease subunit
MGTIVSIFGLVFSVVFLLVFVVAITTPFRSDGSSAMGLLLIGLLTMAASLASMRIRKRPVSVREHRARTGSQAFMKKCVECGKEIPIASEQCQYCQTVQPEYAG